MRTSKPKDCGTVSARQKDVEMHPKDTYHSPSPYQGLLRSAPIAGNAKEAYQTPKRFGNSSVGSSEDHSDEQRALPFEPAHVVGSVHRSLIHSICTDSWDQSSLAMFNSHATLLADTARHTSCLIRILYQVISRRTR